MTSRIATSSNDPRAYSRGRATNDTVRELLVAAALHKLERVRHLIENVGLHPDASYAGKPTALCYAVLKPHFRLMNYLLERGADANAVDRLGMTPLHYATLGGNQLCAAFLVCKGARTDLVNVVGRTPLDLTDDAPHLADCRAYLLRIGAAAGPANAIARH